MTALIPPNDFTQVVARLRAFFSGKGFLEVHTQNRLSILAACEDPTTIAVYSYMGQVWPLPQTGQMWLEYEVLKNPDVPGMFCVSTSYRQEPDPIPDRHDLIFPMFEFEMPGNMEKLIRIEKELCEYLGFGKKEDFLEKNYLDMVDELNTKHIEAKEEGMICERYGNVVCLKNFPIYTHPFWIMKKNEDGDTARKVDVLIHGMETIGSAERSTNRYEMRELFNTISDGMYAKTLFSMFGKERVLTEFEEFLSLDLFPRCGGGIGVTRMISGMKKEDIF